MSKEQFKVGDRLRVVNGPKSLIEEYKDLIVTVTRVGSELSPEDIVATSDKYDPPLVFMPEWTLELVEETVKYEVIYPTIPDDVNKVKSFSNVFIRSGNSWLDITNNNEVMSERYMLRTYGPLTPVKETKYNIVLIDPDGESLHSSGVSKDNVCLFLQKILNSVDAAYIKNYRLGEYLEYTDGLAYKVEEV